MAAFPKMLTVDAAEEFAQNWMPVSEEEEKLILINTVSSCQPVCILSLDNAHVMTPGQVDY